MNNAGTGSAILAMDMTIAQWRHVVATDLDGARDTLTELTSEWGLDKGEIDRWTARAAATTTANHAYSTRVFRADPIDLVTLELQVEHHVEQDGYIVDALFSWDAEA